MDFTLEVIPLPVTDIDRARDFYRDKVGFHVDIDQEVMPGMRIVQLTPPGSGCSIALGEAIWDMAQGQTTPAPGTYQGLQLCVTDIKAAHAELVGRGLEVSEPVRYAPDDGATFMYFKDPDGNGWAVQEYRRRETEPLHQLLADLKRQR
ncbi:MULTISPECIES: VOC family protein [unclassified Streptomyces]|uniref:VOC family protein n=1 Tax=unclassified Streptomyces TaxID=2593676 RepID=UPI0024431A66|nr:VOC family protein [Streptomyces sp. DH41]MDG9725819.1 VOC family protein [Streptomyces sp. DH41]